MTLKALPFYGFGKHAMLTGIVLFFISVLPAFAQTAKTGDPVKIKSAQWQPLIQNESVEINYKYADCNLPSEGTHNEYYYLQIINKTNKKLQVGWMQEYWYNNKCVGCGAATNENNKKVILMPNETKEGNCSVKSDQALAIFSKMLAVKIKSELTDFNIRNLQVISQ